MNRTRGRRHLERRCAGWLAAIVSVVATRHLSGQSSAVAITHATVVDVIAGRTLSDQTILVDGNRIRRVAAGTVQIPAGARVLDATGKFVIPGLWDMHVHATGAGIDRLFLPVLAANGVTGVREMFGQFAWYDSARALAKRGAIVSPRIVGAGHILDGKPAVWGPMSLGVATPQEARRAVDSLAAAGAAFIKVYSRLTREELLAVADESKKRGLSFAGHVPTLVSAVEASDAGMKSVEHLTTFLTACSRDDERLRAELAAAVASPRGWDSASVLQRAQAKTLGRSYDVQRCKALAATLKKNGTWMVPTITVLRSTAFLDDTTLAADPRLAYIPKFFSDSWNPKADFRFRAMTAEDWAVRKTLFAEQMTIVRLLHDAGVPFLAGTDLSNPYIYPGFSLHDELANLVTAGFTPAEALRAATYDPARYFAATDSLGTVAQGKVADLVVLDANPLADIRNTQRIFAVVLNGRVIDAAEREALLAEGRNLAKP